MRLEPFSLDKKAPDMFWITLCLGRGFIYSFSGPRIIHGRAFPFCQRHELVIYGYSSSFICRDLLMLMKRLRQEKQYPWAEEVITKTGIAFDLRQYNYGSKNLRGLIFSTEWQMSWDVYIRYTGVQSMSLELHICLRGKRISFMWPLSLTWINFDTGMNK